MVDRCIEVPGADSFSNASILEIVHQSEETWLRLLVYHGCAFDVSDLLHSWFLFILWEAVDVVEDICRLFNSKS